MKRIREHAAVKSISGIVLLLAIFSAIVSIIGFNSFTEALLDQYAEGAFLTAETAAQLLDADRIDEYARSNGTTEEYQAIWKRLDQLCNSSGSTFIYLIQPDRSDYAHITFLFSTINHESSYSLYDFGYVRETTNDEYREKYRALYDLEADKELVIRDKGHIETDQHITAMISIKGTDGQVKAILCVQRQMEVMVRVRLIYLQKVTAVLIVLALLVIVGQSVFLHRMLLQPLRKMSEEAKRFSTENVAAEKKLRETIRNKDEIGLLAASIDTMEEQIQSHVENLTKITAEKERISTELSLAARIQEDMLPNSFPAFPERHEFDVYASMDPAKAVGGDFYDFFLVDGDHLCMVIADVSGKGIPAALFMMASKIILANNTMLGKTPSKVLMDANAAICSHNREEMFVTVWLGILELSTGKVTAANAGHEYPVLRHAGGCFETINDPHGFVIGGMEGMRYKEYQFQMDPGDKLFLYTDGVPEATNADNKLFGTERMLNALNTVKDASPQGVLKGVRQAVDGFVKDAEQFDDLTMLCVEYRGCEKTDNS